MTYLKDTLKGISWMGALTVLTKSVAIGKIAILARILSPAQFGTYGIALLVLGFLEVITETGINIFLIQEKDKAIEYLNSAWVVSIIRGFLISVLIFISTPIIMLFFKTPGISYLLYLVAVVAIIRGFINPMEVFFQKKLQFMKVFIFKGGLYLLDAIVAVSLGILLHSEIAMVISMVAAALVEVFLSFYLFTEKPRLVFEKDKFLRVLNSGKWITGAGLFSYIFQNMDNVIVGRFLGTTSLGFYQQSYSIATLPVAGVSDVFNRVMFPIFVNMSAKKEELKKTFYKSLGVIFIFALFFGIVILLFSEPIILLFLGSKWLVIESTLKILTIFGILKSLLNSTYSLLLSLKMQKTVMISEFFGIMGMAIVIYPMVIKYGTSGAAISTIIAVICGFPVILINVKKIFNSI